MRLHIARWPTALLNPLKRVEIPWDAVWPDFAWIGLTQGEGYVVTYLLKHPDTIDTGLELKGVEVPLVDGPIRADGVPEKLAFADIIFSEKAHYYLVEAKESIDNSDGTEQATHNAELLEAALRKTGMTDFQVTPVFAGIKYPDTKKGYYVGVAVK